MLSYLNQGATTQKNMNTLIGAQATGSKFSSGPAN